MPGVASSDVWLVHVSSVPAMPILGNIGPLWAAAGRCGAMHFHCETRLISILGMKENGILQFPVNIMWICGTFISVHIYIITIYFIRFK